MKYKQVNYCLLTLAIIGIFYHKTHNESISHPSDNQPVNPTKSPEHSEEKPTVSTRSTPKWQSKPSHVTNPTTGASPVRNAFLSLQEGAERGAFLDQKLTMTTNVTSSVQEQHANESIQTWDNEMKLRSLSSNLRRGMSTQQMTNILGNPSKIGTVLFTAEGPEFPGMLMDHTNGTWYIYSPHPEKTDMGIGDDFRVLELWFNPEGELADGAWVKPVRN